MQPLKSFLNSLVDDEYLLESILEGYEAIFEATSGTLFWGTSQNTFDTVTQNKGVLSNGVQMTTDKKLAENYAQFQSVQDQSAPIVVSYNIPQLSQSATIMYHKPKIYAVAGSLSGQIGTPYSAGNQPYVSSGPLKYTSPKPIPPRKGPNTADKLLNVGRQYSNRPGGEGLVGAGAQMLGGAVGVGKDIVNLFRKKK